jgi:hypothetical protein
MRSPWMFSPVSTYFFIALVIVMAAAGTWAAAG